MVTKLFLSWKIIGSDGNDGDDGSFGGASFDYTFSDIIGPGGAQQISDGQLRLNHPFEEPQVSFFH